MDNKDRRLIEDFLPIQAISTEASREKSVRKGHISTLHLWWARRPLVACRAAIYGALVPALRFIPENGPDNKKQSLGRANAAKFIKRLCRYPSDSKPEEKADIERTVKEAQKHILEAHAERLTNETGKEVTVMDIEEGRAPRPKVLDMFAGGGAIPLEALRLGCEAHALDLNPVAHIIELCTLVYPQRYGKPDPNVRGMTGPKNAEGRTTWGGLASEVRYWGEWVLNKVKAEIGDLYPLIPDPQTKKKGQLVQSMFPGSEVGDHVPLGYLSPAAYLWTRTVRCKNPSCRATVPLVKQTWLCKKKDRYIALKIVADDGKQQVRFEVVKAVTENGLGFDPAAGSKGGNATCPFCGTVANIDYVKSAGCSKQFGEQLIAVVAVSSQGNGKVYLASSDVPTVGFRADGTGLSKRAEEIASKFDIIVPNEPLEPNPRSFDVQHFGFEHWKDVFTPRQLTAMICFAGHIRRLPQELIKTAEDQELAKALTTCLSMVLGRLADYSSSFCTWQPEFVRDMFGGPGLPMIFDFVEANPLADSSGSWSSALGYVTAALGGFTVSDLAATVVRGSAMNTIWADRSFDAIVTDPPYYDSRSYSNLADHFYVWHKQAIASLYPEHFASELTPKKNEAIAATYRHGGSKEKSDLAYEKMMQKAFVECHRLLRPGCPLICVYAHKTTAGWSTLINAMMNAGFTVVEAWPVEMERKVRQNAQKTAALASSILLVAIKREASEIGSYESAVRPQLEATVRERVESLWKMGIFGADLVIAAVGAGLRAFTRFERVEYANGERVPAEHFLLEVETTVLEKILRRLSKQVGASGQVDLAGVDPATRFYILWRFTYRAPELDGGEAIVFANGVHVELDGPGGLSTGSRALLTKKKGKYILTDFTERGDNEKLGMQEEDGQSAPIIDALHRILWLMEYNPSSVSQFLLEVRPNLEQMRLVAQVLAGPVLRGGKMGQISPTKEMEALAKLTSNWRSVIEDASMTVLEKQERITGQKPIPFGGGERQ